MTVAALLEYVQDGWDAAVVPGSIRLASGRLVGRWVSPTVDLSLLGTAQASIVEWTATAPTGTSVTVEVRLSFDGGVTWGAWQAATNGADVPGLAPGTDVSQGRLEYRVTLVSNDPAVSPEVQILSLLFGFLGSVQRHFALRPRLKGLFIQHRIEDSSPETVTLLAVGERWRPLRKMQASEVGGSIAT